MDETTANIPSPRDPLLERLKNTFFLDYFPVAKFKTGVIFMATKDIYNLWQNLYPDEYAYTAADVAVLMHEKGFQFIQRTDQSYEWMLLPQE